jgi:hypothetical protein
MEEDPIRSLKMPNQYRRAFDWGVSTGPSQDFTNQFEAALNVAKSELPDLLEDFLELSRKKQHNRTAVSRLQLHMLEELLVQEGVAKSYRQRLQGEGSGQEMRISGTDHEGGGRSRDSQDLFGYRMYANAIRAIGDGIAWRALKFDRAVTRLMSEQATKQYLSSPGTLEELREWSSHFGQGLGLSILNALTNCLAIGDVTLIRDDDSVEIIEVKSSNAKSGRKIRQKRKMEEVVTILSAGVGRTQNKEVRIEILPLTPETGLPTLGRLLSQASAGGWASGRISNSLYLEAFDLLKIQQIETLQPKLSAARRELTSDWESRGDFVMRMSSIDAIQFTPNSAPFSIFPFDSRTCVDLLLGAKFYISYLNFDAVEREFRHRGWNIERTREDLSKAGNVEAYLEISKDDFHVLIPPSEYMRMQMELLRPQTLIEAYEQERKRGHRHAERFILPLYEGEPEIWL